MFRCAFGSLCLLTVDVRVFNVASGPTSLAVESNVEHATMADANRLHTTPFTFYTVSARSAQVHI